MSEWQDISTAPKNGTVILGYSKYDKRIGAIQWEDGDSQTKGYWTGISLCLSKPTHWMPLPNLPEEK